MKAPVLMVTIHLPMILTVRRTKVALPLLVNVGCVGIGGGLESILKMDLEQRIADRVMNVYNFLEMTRG